MKTLKISLTVAAVLSLSTSTYAQSLQESFTNGKVSGEIAATYEQRDVSQELAKWSNYYSNTAYSVGSLALKYKTQEWNNLTLTSKFRAYSILFEGGKNETHYAGTGDAAERFYETGNNKTVDLEELFLAYQKDNISLKVGRQFISTDWINKTQDAVKLDASFGNTSIEAIYSKRQGRIYSRDYRPMTDINNNDGVYKLALTQKFNDNLSATVYDFIAPNNRDIIGGKINGKFADTSFRAHYAVNKPDDSTQKNSSIIDLMVSTSIGSFSPYAGYVKIDKDEGFTHVAGETIIPFEEGDQMYLKNAKTYYVGVSKSFGNLSSTLLYGLTKYDKGTTTYEQNETTLWLGYPITKDLQANMGYTYVGTDNSDTDETDLNQLNFTLTYSF